ncbi:hypothetical protein TNIN_54091 [Trichonephila inaurata madagascariensis]|uniref:Uncharacterized protein n=1 Tax=Trichonephila inaurata madagascariensis TaxID=2747483 RepID=A0A8X6JWU1_9ARAC|nr:hypothetical protein TNIN_54091 [Trichonephila inaurata madagascariensis]
MRASVCSARFQRCRGGCWNVVGRWGSNLVGQRLAWDQPFRRSTGSLETRLRILSEPLRGLPREETIAGFGGKFIQSEDPVYLISLT